MFPLDLAALEPPNLGEILGAEERQFTDFRPRTLIARLHLESWILLPKER